MKCLCFDIDGTLLVGSTGKPKPALASGRLEAAIREAAVDRLICVANFASVVHTMHAVDPGFDGLGALFALCQGVFRDEVWFRRVTRLAEDPRNRGLEVSQESDWWYVDDLAHEYLARAGLDALFKEENGHRILVPNCEGDGSEVIEWLRLVGSGHRVQR